MDPVKRRAGLPAAASLEAVPRACGAVVRVILGRVSSEGTVRGFTPPCCLFIGFLSSPWWGEGRRGNDRSQLREQTWVMWCPKRAETVPGKKRGSNSVTRENGIFSCR